VTDHIPNDLSHLSKEEFNSLCPQGEHAPGPEPLSPAAQAVLDAFLAEWPDEALEQDRRCLAAALRAVADQVVPVPKLPYDSCCDVYASAIRAKLIAIADELERHA
jgi:hypothetical protein